MVWPLPRSLATTSGISVDFFSSPYLDVSVQAVPFIHLWIQCMMTELHSAGFPHSEIHGSMAGFASPWLIADPCVLRRLLVPRHSPCALCSLTINLKSLGSFSNSLDDKFVVINYPFNLPFHITICCFVQFSRCIFEISLVGGLKWTRTTDLTLIRRAL